MRSSKHGAQKHDFTSDHTFTLLHQRLYNALNLGFRSVGCKRRKWHCVDIGTQKHVVRSISTFVECITTEMWSHPLVRDSVADMVNALVGILQDKNETVLPSAASVLSKLVSHLPSFTLLSIVNVLVHPCSSLLSSDQSEVAISCATTLNLVVSNMSTKMEKEVWDMLKHTSAITHIVCNILHFYYGAMAIEYFQEMTSLLSKILWRWPPSRYSVWNDEPLMVALEDIQMKHDLSVKVEVLKLYAAVALCASGARKILDDCKSGLHLMVNCMDGSHPLPVQMEGFRLAQCLLLYEQDCVKLISIFGEPIVKAIINGLNRRCSSARTAHLHLQLLQKACRLALITRWAGEHHLLFWKLGIDKALLDVLFGHCGRLYRASCDLTLEEQIGIARKYINLNLYPNIVPYIWEILGFLAAYCSEECTHSVDGKDAIDMLITCACLVFLDSAPMHNQNFHSDITFAANSESVSWAVMMLIYSPSKLISSKAKLVLSFLLKPCGLEGLTNVLTKLGIVSSSEKFAKLDATQLSVNLIHLACFLVFPQYQNCVIKGGGLKTLVLVMRWCTSTRPNFSPRLSNLMSGRTCCFASSHWEGGDFLLLLSLWVLAGLIPHCKLIDNKNDLFHVFAAGCEAQFVNELKDICCGSYSLGAKYLAAYVLSCFGTYGFPCKFGDRLVKTLYNDQKFADIDLIFANGDCLSVHGAVLTVRCQALLPPEELTFSEGTGDRNSQEKKKRKVVRMSSHVDYSIFVKLLEFVYLGYLQAGVELVKKLSIIARRCQLQHLCGMLSQKGPQWGFSVPTFEFSVALGPDGNRFSDMIFEVEKMKQSYWTCSHCSSSVPHVHVHRVILWANSEYLRALFLSGMNDSHSRTIKVPVSYEALVKLVHWFYSDKKLLKPPTGCMWDNMKAGDKLDELQSYIELSWLAEFWLLDDLEDECFGLIVSHLTSARELCVNVIQRAADLSRWKLAEVAADFMAPLYCQLHNSGKLEALDENLCEMIRAASVRFSQEST
uniref:BTB domain-containing protein n=1 Tax=Kalanchoe fedtschenkoi TaxID=63787 RepID=A0A7N0RH46_KALFE